jgi:Zn-dependent peptidase ImmA (M78 family)
MNIPKVLKVGGQTYEVKIVDKCSTDNKAVDAYIKYDESIIEVRSDIKGDYKIFAFLHELVHAVYDFCGFEQDEDNVSLMARALHMVFNDNPDIFKD